MTTEPCKTCGSTDGTALWHGRGSTAWHRWDSICLKFPECTPCTDPFHTQPQTTCELCGVEDAHSHNGGAWLGKWHSAAIAHHVNGTPCFHTQWVSPCDDEGCPHSGIHPHEAQASQPVSDGAMETAQQCRALFNVDLFGPGAEESFRQVAILIQALVDKETARLRSETATAIRVLGEQLTRWEQRAAKAEGEAEANKLLAEAFPAMHRERDALREQVRVLREAMVVVLEHGGSCSSNINPNEKSCPERKRPMARCCVYCVADQALAETEKP